MSWAAEELAGVSLGDARRNRRLVQVVEDLAARPGGSVGQASRSRAAMQATYQLWSNRRVEAEDILAGHQQSVVERIREHAVVLALQDTSELDYSEHRKRTKDLGPLSDPEARGLKLHSVLAVSDAGVPLGVLHQQMWHREVKPGMRKERRQREIEEKESVRWLESLEVSQQVVPEGVQVITIADREADIYELFAHPRRRGSELLIRAAQNRNTKRNLFSPDVQPLFSVVLESPVAGKKRIELQRTPRRKPRPAELTVRYAQVWLQPPAHLGDLAPMEMWAVLAEEETPPEKESPVRWLLLSTLAVESFESACECLRRYALRWLIERYFYALKTGCQVERLQLEESDRIERAVATYSIVAWRLMWLMYEARRQPERTVEGILKPEEWQALYLLVRKSKEIPEIAPSLGECIRLVAQLGGFWGGKGDGDPGIQTIWRGWVRVSEIAAVWELLQGQ